MTLRGLRNEKEIPVRPSLSRRQHGGIFLCAASMPLVAGAVFLGRERERMTLRKLVETHIVMQLPLCTYLKKNFEMPDFLQHLACPVQLISLRGT